MRGEAPEAALAKLEELFEVMLEDIGPGQRKMVARKIGQALRRNQSKRIAANEEPDGGAMAARKKRPRKKGKRGPRRKMFREIRKTRNLKVKASQDGVELRFANRNIERTAAEHHYGLEGFVGKSRSGETIRTRYTARRLLGFAPEDIEEMTDTLLEWLDRD